MESSKNKRFTRVREKERKNERRGGEVGWGRRGSLNFSTEKIEKRQ